MPGVGHVKHWIVGRMSVWCFFSGDGAQIQEKNFLNLKTGGWRAIRSRDLLVPWRRMLELAGRSPKPSGVQALVSVSLSFSVRACY